MGRFLHSIRHTLLGDPASSDGTAPALQVRVKCRRCGEVIAVRVDKANDLLCEFGDVSDEAPEPPPPTGYTLHKEVVGRKCQNLVHFTMHFDDHRRVTGREIEGGEFVGWEDTN